MQWRNSEILQHCSKSRTQFLPALTPLGALYFPASRRVSARLLPFIRHDFCLNSHGGRGRLKLLRKRWDSQGGSNQEKLRKCFPISSKK